LKQTHENAFYDVQTDGWIAGKNAFAARSTDKNERQYRMQFCSLPGSAQLYQWYYGSFRKNIIGRLRDELPTSQFPALSH